MRRTARILVGLIAFMHFGISAAEMFLWKNPAVYTRLDKFDFCKEEAEKIAPIVANAGLYNAFIAAGLVWSLFAGSNSRALQFFFLSCVAIAGVYGAVTLKPDTVLLQTLPALLALFFVWRAKEAA